MSNSAVFTFVSFAIVQLFIAGMVLHASLADGLIASAGAAASRAVAGID